MFKWFWTIFSLGAPDLGGFMWFYSYLSMNQWPDKSWSVESDLQKKPLRLRLTQLLCHQVYFLWVFFKYPKISKKGNPLFFPVVFCHLHVSLIFHKHVWRLHRWSGWKHLKPWHSLAAWLLSIWKPDESKGMSFGNRFRSKEN